MAETDEAAPPTDQLGTMDLTTDTSLNHAFSDRVLIRSIVGRPDGGAGLAGKRVRVGGWVKTGREQAKGTLAFLELNDGSCPANLQAVVDAGVAVPKKLVAMGTCVVVDGILKIPPPPPQKQGTKQRPQRIELGVEKVLHIGEVADPAKYPIPKRNPTLEYLRDHLHLRSRTNTIAAIARIRNALAFATHSFFQEHHFLYVHTPIITTSDCEGAGEMFQVTTLINEADKNPNPQAKQLGIPKKKDGKIDYTKDFFARQAYLTVSGQLQVETYACGLSNVYTFGPTFRAEHSHTSRHLAEFWMVEPEIAFAELNDAMNCAEAYVKYLCKWLLDKCLDDLQFMDDKTCVDRLRMVAETPFVRISYTEAVKILEESGQRFEHRVEWGIYLASEHERYLTEVQFQKPVIVYNYPKGIKAFYMRLNDDLETVAAMDVLVPKVGELIGGSQREERYEVIRERILEMGLPLEPYEWYLDLRRYGTVKHCGFGLGFERMILFATGIDNIRDVIPFPRYPGRADL
ncbi:Aspartyl/Asparaginyl-tRNA synthetase, class IIb [Corchorus capsularis]|uniref:asparagine--tRNA ligase n=1 Tax=Corchorus capsularis TaxID=210143 RepID=A0A1R3HJK5_COCAP|nr:Aspartyl/Asparaginyl-tRNA synthetase, class IIb [Corchorus capsularis]